MAKKKEENPTGASRRTVKQHITSGEFSRVYLLYGAEQYLTTFYRDQIRDALLPRDDNMNCTVYDADSFSVNSLINDAITMPFFADHRVVIVNNSGYFDASDPAFIDSVNQIPDTNVVIFCEQKVNKTKKAFLDAKKNENVTCLEFAGMEKSELVTWLGSILGDGDVKVKLSVPEKILDACGPSANMYMLENEARKIHDYCLDKGVIGPEDVAKLCPNEVEDKVFEMCRFISQKNSAQAISLYNDLLSLKRKAIPTIKRIEAQYTQLLTVKQLQQDGLNSAQITDKLRLSKWIGERVIGLANSYTKRQLIDAIDACQEATFLNNSGGLVGNASIENLIIKLLA